MTALVCEDSQLLHPRMHAVADGGKEMRRQLFQLSLEFAFMEAP